MAREKQRGKKEIETNRPFPFIYKARLARSVTMATPGQNGPSPLAEMSEPMRRRDVGGS